MAPENQYEALMQRLHKSRDKAEKLRITNYSLRRKNQEQAKKYAELEAKYIELKRLKDE